MPVTTRSMSRSNSAKKLGNLPWNAITRHMSGPNFISFYVSMPPNVRKQLDPIMQRYKKIATMRSKINFRGPINTRRVTPAYIHLVRGLSRINNRPNEYYESRGQTSTGYHTKRIQNAMNLLRRLRRTNEGFYVNNQNNGRRYQYNKGVLTAVPRVGGGVYITVARGIKRTPGGRLFFKLNTKRSRR